MISLVPWLKAVQSLFFWFAFVSGACVGSFLNVCILRIPAGTFFSKHRSHCPACDAAIPMWLNIPVVSFLLLRGRAKCCGAKLSWQYPAVEFVTACIFAAAYVRFPFFGWDLGSGFFESEDFWRWLHFSAFVSLMLTMSIIDARHMIIPDGLSLGMLAFTPVVVWLHPDLDARSAAIGAVVGAGVLYAVAWIYWLVRRQYGLGFGDVKLLAAIGGWLGWQAIFPTLFLGSIVGSIIAITGLLVARRFSFQARIPFGPYLAGGAVVYLWLGNGFILRLLGE